MVRTVITQLEGRERVVNDRASSQDHHQQLVFTKT